MAFCAVWVTVTSTLPSFVVWVGACAFVSSGVLVLSTATTSPPAVSPFGTLVFGMLAASAIAAVCADCAAAICAAARERSAIERCVRASACSGVVSGVLASTPLAPATVAGLLPPATAPREAAQAGVPKAGPAASARSGAAISATSEKPMPLSRAQRRRRPCADRRSVMGAGGVLMREAG